MRRPRLGACICLLLWLPTVVNAQDGRQPEGGTVTSTNQSGGVTAYSIGKVYVSEAPKIDQTDEKLARTLSVMRNSRMLQARTGFALPVYTALLNSPPEAAAPQGSDVVYNIIAFADESDAGADFTSVCGAAGGGPVVGGNAVYLTEEDGSAKTTTRLLTKADGPFLQPICDSLAKPLSFLRTRAGTSVAGDDEEQTVFEFLARGTDLVVLILLPGNIQGRDVEALMARHYWSSALVMRYSRVPSIMDLATDPDATGDLAGLLAGGTAASQTPFGGRFFTHDGVEAYPTEAVREFGPRIAELDASWLRYLAASALTVGGEQRPLFVSGKPGKVLPRFRPQDLATAAFWRGLPDHSLAAEMISCVAGRFLEDHYRAPTTELDLGRCATSETSWKQK
ncbi:MAG: hypothetical protein EOP62_11750 [Sphingomonadales bacterium]|nr:MAG: hypothetical protein EOP62_11750 [Sphingomonadales bacterium]